MKQIVRIVGLILLIGTGSCKKEKIIPIPGENFIVNETADKGQLKMELSWEINGVKDNGMMADMEMYLSKSNTFNFDDRILDRSYSSINFSSSDLQGGKFMNPSFWDLSYSDRYFIGVAFNGFLSNTSSLVFPVQIKYTIKLANEKQPDKIEYITGVLSISSSEQLRTKIEYQYSIDIVENGDKYKSYSFRALDEPTVINRACDREAVTSFHINYPLYVELYWTVNGIADNRTIDLDLILHDTTRANVFNYDDLDFYSGQSNLYEAVYVPAADPKFVDNVPEKLGFYFYNKTGSGPAHIEFMYKIYTYSTISKKQFVGTGSFDAPPFPDDNGHFYFDINITKQGTQNVVTVIPATEEW